MLPALHKIAFNALSPLQRSHINAPVVEHLHQHPGHAVLKPQHIVRPGRPAARPLRFRFDALWAPVPLTLAHRLAGDAKLSSFSPRDTRRAVMSRLIARLHYTGGY